MAGRSQGQNRGRQQRQQGPTYTYGMADLLRQAARLPGVKQDEDDAGAPMRELTRMATERARAARVRAALDDAEAVLNPPQGGDSMSAEAARALSDMYKGAAEFQRTEAQDARTAAAEAASRVDAARREGAAAATAAAQADAQGTSAIVQMALGFAKESAAAQAAAGRAEGAAQAAAANAQVSVLGQVLTAILPAVVGQHQQAPQQPPDLKSQMQQMGEALTILQKFLPQPQAAAPQGLTLPDILALKADERADWWTREQAKMQADTMKGISSGISETLPHIGQGVAAWLQGKGIQIPGLGAPQPGATLPPPPMPGGDA